MMIAPIHLKKKENKDYRMIVISDIHGHLDRFKALLHEVQYTPNDYLVIVGDFVEKGDQVIDTIHFIQELDKNEKTFVLTGNCEWALCALLLEPELAHQIPLYLKRVSSNGCIRDVYHCLHLDNGKETLLGIQKKIAEYLKSELKYISHLPVTLKFNDFLFVHAGVEKRKDYENCSLSSLLEMQHFYEHGHILDEMVIVGHLPTSNYFKKYINNDILIDKQKKIICIDGGTGVKSISQLNAFIITSYQGHISFDTKYVQPLPEAMTIKNIMNHQEDIHKIAYPYFEVTVLEKGNQFSLCSQKETHQTLKIKNEFLYQKNNQVYCLDDYTDYMLSVKKNQKIKVIGVYDQYVYAIYQNHVGWIKLENICMNF